MYIFLELFYILFFIVSPLTVFLLNIKITKKYIFGAFALLGFLFLLEYFEFVKLHEYFHNVISLFLYIIICYIVLEYYKSIRSKIHRVILICFSIFFHFLCVIFLLFNHILSLLDNPISTTIYNNIYAIETRYGGAWTYENMVKVQILQSFGILSVVKFSEYFVDNEVRYSYDTVNNTLEIFIKKDNAGEILKIATIFL